MNAIIVAVGIITVLVLSIIIILVRLIIVSVLQSPDDPEVFKGSIDVMELEVGSGGDQRPQPLSLGLE